MHEPLTRAGQGRDPDAHETGPLDGAAERLGLIIATIIRAITGAK